MIFIETRLKGAFVIKPEMSNDERGFFARSFCKKEFGKRGLNTKLVQTNVSYNRRKGTFRGMHFQTPPFEEDKLVTCVNGGIVDYIIDLREESPTFMQWVSTELSAHNMATLYVPRSFAHGFITTEDDTRIVYQMTAFYRPRQARGVRWNDPAFRIEIPFPITAISEKDTAYADFDANAYRLLRKRYAPGLV